jgi:flagellar biogenesis protein FliO
MDAMAQWIGLTIGTACVALLAAPCVAASASDRVEQSIYQSPVDSRSAVDNPPRAPHGPLANRAESMPIIMPRENAAADKSAAPGARKEMPATPSSAPALLSMLGSLAIVLGLFFGLIWLMRRGMPKGTRLVSSEVVEVLGRASLGGRQQMHVVRFGNKLLLVSLSPGGAETLSEITEPAEVDRLAGICQQSHSNSATNAFRQVFRQFGDDRTAGGVRGSSSKSGGDGLARKAIVPAVMEDDDV